MFTYAGSGATYDVTVDQPGAGGTIDADPTSGPAGTVVALNNSPAEGYTFDHYTLDGEAIDGNTFTLNSDVTVSGVFHAVETYAVWVIQSEGGTISAGPESGPAETTVTLSNSPAEGYTFDHYTLNGAVIDGDTFTLNSDVTVSGVFYAAESLKITIRYSYYNPENDDNIQDVFSDLPLDIPATGPVSITIENYTDFAGYDLSWITLDDYENPQTSYRDLPAKVKDRIAADGITIHLRTGSAWPLDISLRNIHLLRMAFNDQDFAMDNVPMDKIYIDMPENQFMPVLDGQLWAYYSYYRIDWENGVHKSFYDFYPKTDTELINGLTIKPDGNPDDNKYKLIVGRALKVTNLFYSWDAPAWQEGIEGTPINGFGWEIGAGGSIVLADPNETIYVETKAHPVFGGRDSIPFADYEAALRSNGLHPSDGVFLNHSEVSIKTDGSNTNIMSNGIYDFILAYYNPDKDYNAADYEIRDEYNPNHIIYTDGRARLPQWRDSEYYLDGTQVIFFTFDGRYVPGSDLDITDPANGSVPLPGRTVDGVPLASRDRKAPADGGAYRKGEPRSDFVNNITVPMVNYMVSSLHIPEFRNTNIIGDGDKWDNLLEGGSGMKNLFLLSTVNIGLIGDYSNIRNLTANMKGVLDLKGDVPIAIYGVVNINKQGWVNLWDDVLRGTLFSNIYVGVVKGTGGDKVIGGDVLYAETIPHVIIYSHKYTDALVSAAATNKPYYRAFVDSRDGKTRITATGLTGDDAKYVGSNANMSIPNLDEDAWIAAGNAGLDKPADDLAANYSGLSADYKWASAADFASHAVE